MPRTYVRCSDLAFSATSEEICGKLGTKETAPSGGGTLTEGLTETPSREVAAVVNATQDDRRRIAGEYLLRVRDDIERSARTRLNYIQNARTYGMTLDEIGGLLGITEGAVRYILKRGGA